MPDFASRFHGSIHAFHMLSPQPAAEPNPTPNERVAEAHKPFDDQQIADLQRKYPKKTSWKMLDE